MPQIARQSAPVGNRPAVKQGIRRVTSTDSILARVVDIEELEECKFSAIFYGVNRIGKTLLACQYPKPLLLVSLDPRSNGGADTVRKIPGIKNIRMGTAKDVAEGRAHINASTDVEKLGRELHVNCPFQTVVIDGLASLEELLLAEICGWDQTADLLAHGPNKPGNKVTQDQYTERSEVLRKRLRPFVDLKTCYVIFISQEKDHNPPESRKAALVRGPQAESLIGPAVGSGVARWLNNSCNFIIQLYFDKEVKLVKHEAIVGKQKIVTEDWVETGKIVRRARLKLHQNFMAGFSSPYVDGVEDLVPEYIEAVTPKEMYEKIMSVARGVKVK